MIGPKTVGLLPFALFLLVLEGCGEDRPGPSSRIPPGDPEPTAVLVQAVDAGTGGALADDRLTIRHLVRFPVTLDAAGTEEVPATDPFRLEHSVAGDSLVVEVRLEAPSYHRLDTALAAPRGGSVGPVTLRLTRQLASAEEVAENPPPTRPRPTDTRDEEVPVDPDEGIDRGPLQAGNRAFESGNWVAATNAFMAMPPPENPTGPYAEDYVRARVRQGASHIQLGEWGGALNALEEAVTFPSPGYNAYLLLAQAQCTVGRLPQGRETLDRVDAMAARIPAAERAIARALTLYQRANCAYQEFIRVQDPMEMIGSGSTAIRAYETFIQEGEALTNPPGTVVSALDDARSRVSEIRERMRGGGEGFEGPP